MAGVEQPEGLGRELRRRLKDGTPVTVLLLAPEHADRTREWLKARIAEGYRQLSPRSRRLRFISPPCQLAPWQLDHLSDLDPAHNAVWVARDDSALPPVGVGLCRCMRLAAEPSRAEVALTVLDDYQNRGMGRIFLELVIDYARAQGLRSLHGYVLPENRPMLHLFAALGGGPPVAEEGLLRVEVPLTPPPPPPSRPRTPGASAPR